MVVARQLFTRFKPRALDVVLFAAPEDLKGDAAENYRMLTACGCPVWREITPDMRNATMVVDALLGTGITGPATGAMLAGIRAINTGFPLAKVVAVDIPSGMGSDFPQPLGEQARADYTVTFTAPEAGAGAAAQLRRAWASCAWAPSEARRSFTNPTARCSSRWSSRRSSSTCSRPRAPGAHKGDFGHVLVVAGSRGKTGAAAMAGLSALRAGAGLVTIASAESAIPVIAGYAPELMTEPLPETETGGISLRAFDYGRLEAVIAPQGRHRASGPGLGAPCRNRRHGAATGGGIRAAHGDRRRRSQRTRRAPLHAARPPPRADAASRRDVAPDRQDDGRNRGRPRRPWRADTPPTSR